jgi:ribosomal protein S18 acetylase RimI-like enzyme
MDYSIIPIAEEHIEGFRAALDYVAREGKYLVFTEAPPREDSRAFVMNNIGKDYPHFVVLSGGRVVGWCDVIPGERAALARCGTLGIGLLPEFRGRGIGGAAMKKAIEKARAQGMARVALTVRTKNENAIALYKKLGFETEGLHRKAHFCLDGTYEDVYTMALVF